jgi:hypothetical protein
MIIAILYHPPSIVIANVQRCPCSHPSTVVVFASTTKITIFIVVMIVNNATTTTTIALIVPAVFEVASTTITIIVF